MVELVWRASLQDTRACRNREPALRTGVHIPRVYHPLTIELLTLKESK